MRIVILPVSRIEEAVLNGIRSGLSKVFAQSSCQISDGALKIAPSAYNPSRQQHVSSVILSDILDYAEEKVDSADTVYRVLGVTDADLYVPRLNFVFGEAQCPGKAALISVYRLRPLFYGEPADERLFLERCVKEAVHEIGHTLGLRHCPEPSCVMHFSLHIGMTDRKRADFCERCHRTAERMTRMS